MDVASLLGVRDALKRTIVHALLGSCSCSLNLRLVPAVEVEVGAEVGAMVGAVVEAEVEVPEPEFESNIFMLELPLPPIYDSLYSNSIGLELLNKPDTIHLNYKLTFQQ